MAPVRRFVGPRLGVNSTLAWLSFASDLFAVGRSCYSAVGQATRLDFRGNTTATGRIAVVSEVEHLTGGSAYQNVSHGRIYASLIVSRKKWLLVTKCSNDARVHCGARFTQTDPTAILSAVACQAPNSITQPLLGRDCARNRAECGYQNESPANNRSCQNDCLLTRMYGPTMYYANRFRISTQ